MKLFKIFKSGFINLKSSLKRFPYALIFSTLTTIILIYYVNMEKHFNTEQIEIFIRLALTTALGFPLFLIIKTFFERKTKIKVIQKIIIRLIALFILIGYYFFLLKEINMVTATRYIAVSLALYLLFITIAYFKNKRNFELYVVKIFTRLLITSIYSFVLFGGLSITLFTLDKLLNLPVTEEIYFSTFLTVIGLFAPIFLLAKIPKQNDNVDIKHYPRVLEILFLYIVMPLISIYTTILYIYFVKILLIQQWPEGLVAHLVLWYAALSIIILFFISPLKQKNKWVQFFSKWLPIAIIPLLLMMFSAIKIRIDAYGVTENRYFVVLLGLWTMGIMIYYIFSKKKSNIFLPLSLAIIALLAVFGPWSSYSVSIYSQNQRFANIAQKYDMLQEGAIVNKVDKIKKEDQKEIIAILRYFEYNHKFNDLKYLPADFTTDDIEEFFGFSYQPKYNPDQFEHFSYNLNQNKQAISLKNYNYLFHLSTYHTESSSLENNIKVNLNNENNEIIITQNGVEIYRKSLIPILKKLHTKNKNISKEKLNSKDFIYIDEKENIKLKFIFISFYGTTVKTNLNNININNLNFYLLIKI